MRWKIFYVDGSTFSNQDGAPEDALGSGVVAIAQEDELVGVQIHSGSDFYCFAEEFDGWYGLDYFGLAQYLIRPGMKIVKLGEVMSTQKYRELIMAIQKDSQLPNKSSRYPWERKF